MSSLLLSRSNADAIWRALNNEHQKLFPATSCSIEEPSAVGPAASLPRSEAAGLIEEAIAGDAVLIFGQRPKSLTGSRRRGRPTVPEQPWLFNVG
jgi:hypothetical protein